MRLGSQQKRGPSALASITLGYLELWALGFSNATCEITRQHRFNIHFPVILRFALEHLLSDKPILTIFVLICLRGRDSKRDSFHPMVQSPNSPNAHSARAGRGQRLEGSVSVQVSPMDGRKSST